MRFLGVASSRFNEARRAAEIYAGVALGLGLVYLGYTIRFGRIVRAQNQTESRMYARDLLKVSVIYLPLLLTALMLNAK